MAPRNPMVLLRDALILRITHLFHPFNKLTVELFLNRDVHHRRHCRGAMPMLLAGGIQTTSPGRISSMGPASR